MIQNIDKMTLEQIITTKEKISLSSASRKVKSELYALCEEREKALNLDNAIVEMSEYTNGDE